MIRHAPAILEAIEATFGAEPERLERLAGGPTGATQLKLELGGAAYVVRHVAKPSPLNDPARKFGCMAWAAARSLAPRMFHANAVTGVCITASSQVRRCGRSCTPGER